jgi:hypothetical protein
MFKKPGFTAFLEAVVLVIVGLTIVVAAAYARGATPDGGLNCEDAFGDPPTLDESPAPVPAPVPAPAPVNDDASSDVANDTNTDANSEATDPFDEIIAHQYDGSRQRLRALGMDDSHFEKLIDGRPIVLDEHETLLLGLDRLREISLGHIEKWTRDDVSWAEVIADARAAGADVAARKYPGQMFPVVGRITHVEVRRALPSQVPFFGTDRYFRCEVTQAEGQPPVVVFTQKIPKGWRRGQKLEKGDQWTLDEPVRFVGVFLKLGPAEPEQNVILMTRHLGWYPDRVDPALGIAPQHVLLAGMGMDIGLFDSVDNSKRISGREHECFYQLLGLMGRLDAEQLEQAAVDELLRLRTAWPQMAEDYQQQSEAADDSKKKKQLKNNAGAALLAAEVAESGRFSVFPLFNLANRHRCQLMTLEGTARRILKVQVDDPVGPSRRKQEIVSRFGLDHFYQIYLFTKDSRDNPIVFNVREVPPDLPLGDDLSEHVKITGFFYKTWPYRDRSEASDDNRHTAPLLIGRRLHWFPDRPNPLYSDEYRSQGLMAVGLVFLALMGLCLALWMWRRGDKQFEKIAISKNYSIEPGQSLNDMGIEADDEPDFSGLK